MTIFKSPTHRVFKIVSLACLPALFLVLAGFLLHFRVVGRHFTPLVPAVLLLLAIGVSGLWWRRGWFSRLLVGLFFGLLVVSCLSLRLSPRHAKDDYRSAAAFAHDAQASGKDVWWCAAPEGARFYGLHLWPADAPEPQERAINVTNLPVEALPAAPRPAFVVISKPDLYDNQGTVARFLAEHHYLVILELPGFSIWAPRTGSGAQNWGE